MQEETYFYFIFYIVVVEQCSINCYQNCRRNYNTETTLENLLYCVHEKVVKK